ncbi:hypothetical protein DWF00_24470 [Bosea caraganae]|uniref:TIGR02186 family protein n=1 Tax=Bosea caraganae TaxID=2763117 RepID=A0A370L5K9_9HYPH|nr:TIGR02186 family protein [Bosea caraganae]RDJ22365.1 hypothetical protein DWF00_24470 [Bosea caraganae]RDJ23701.1 hypothetical protein DWE98_16285 [Bosea caraganae]
MKWALASFVIGLGALGLPGAARAESLIASVSSHQIQISSNYTGDQVTVFGLIERDGKTTGRGDPYDLVVTVRGPQRMLLVRQKERLGPIWINRTQRRFPDSSVFLTVASNRPLREIISPDSARRDRIGLMNAQRVSDVMPESYPDMDRFREAMVRLLDDKGLYSEEERGVTFLSPTLFSAPINVPATAPTGPYEVEVLLYAGGVQLARQTTNFEVIKTGIEQGLASGAHDRPLLYGLATATLALLFGWMASVVFRRD